MDLQAFFTQLDTYYRSGDPERAEAHLCSGLRQAEAEGDSGAAISISNELGGLYRVQGRFGAGIRCFQSALNSIAHSPYVRTEGHGTTLLNYATLLTAMGSPAEAAQRFSEAIQVFDGLEHVQPYRLAALYNNLASLRLSLKQYGAALACTEQALTRLEASSQFGDEAGVTHTVRAQIFAQTGEIEAAYQELEQARQAFLICPDASPVHRAAMEQFLGELQFAQERWAEALSAYEQAEALIRAGRGDPRSLEQLCRRQAACRLALDRPEGAVPKTPAQTEGSPPL